MNISTTANRVQISALNILHITREKRRQSSDDFDRRHAVVLHADIVSSTNIVEKDLVLAHQQIKQTFDRLRESVNAHHGILHELRGDAIVAEFKEPLDAVKAAIDFQYTNVLLNKTRLGKIAPEVRIGINTGEIIVSDNFVTGKAVILAQRLEQLAPSGAICLDAKIHDVTRHDSTINCNFMGEQKLKGFNEPNEAYAITMESWRQ